jgi:hypothetical protein
MFLHGRKGLGKKDKKGWRYDKILVHLEKFTPLNCTLDFIIIKLVSYSQCWEHVILGCKIDAFNS